ncbi:OmpA family protein [bacterium]|nr:OmpA family protein [bacterium]
MLKSRYFAVTFGLVAVLTLSAGCGSKKSPETRGTFPKESDISAADAAAAAAAADASANGTVPDAAGLNTTDATTRALPFDPDTLSISEPAGKSLGESGEAIPELTPVYFALDSYDLGDSAKTLIGRAAGYLKTHQDLYVVLRGHCDDTGTDEYNLALGSQRAQAVRKQLIDEGIGAIRLETLSFGESMPAVEGSDEASRAQNRRVEFFVYTMSK